MTTHLHMKTGKDFQVDADMESKEISNVNSWGLITSPRFT